MKIFLEILRIDGTLIINSYFVLCILNLFYKETNYYYYIINY